VVEVSDGTFLVHLGGKIEVTGRYPLAVAGRAHADLEGRRTTGANVLIP
jgi:hypothetical protein